MNPLALPDPKKLRVLEPEHFRAAAAVSESFEQLPDAVRNEADVLSVQEVMRRAGNVFDLIDVRRTALKKPIDALAKEVQAQAKSVLDPMDEIVESCKSKLRLYALAKARAEQARIAEEMEAAEEEGRATPDLTKAEVRREVLAAFAPKIATRVTKRAVVTDSTLLPDAYWIPNQVLIEQHALGPNAIAIPGVTVLSETTVVNR